MKKMVIWIVVMIFLISSVSALNLETLDENMNEKQIFSPGSSVLFKAGAAEDADTATLIILYQNNPIDTLRMKLLSEIPKQFAYRYEIPQNSSQGDYVAKVISKGETAQEEFYVGIEVKSQLISKDEISKVKNISFLKNLWKIIKIILEKLLWIRTSY